MAEIHNHSHQELTMARRLSREILEAQLNCRHKSHLDWAGERGEPADYEVLLAGLRTNVRQQAVDKIATSQPATDLVRQASLAAALLKAGPAFFWTPSLRKAMSGCCSMG